MAFVKLDCGMLDSTIWVDRDARELFVTALLMAAPHEIREPMETIQVDSLDPGDYTVPIGWYGFVPAAGMGIIARAGMEKEEGIDALRRLSSPEDESRTPDHGGRRMVRVNGGYVVLNFDKYRQKDHTGAERSKRYRERKQEESRVANVTSRVTPRRVTQAEAEAEAGKSRVSDSPNPSPVASDETRSFLDSLWKLSPRTSRPRTSRKDVTAAWKSIPAKDRPTHDEALAAYLAWTKCEAWTKENGQYVCGLHLWIRKRQWENVPEGDTPGAGCRKLSNEKGF
jgi:hypothetical protein